MNWCFQIEDYRGLSTTILIRRFTFSNQNSCLRYYDRFDTRVASYTYTREPLAPLECLNQNWTLGMVSVGEKMMRHRPDPEIVQEIPRLCCVPR
jgi:hypothetical protein